MLYTAKKYEGRDTVRFSDELCRPYILWYNQKRNRKSALARIKNERMEIIMDKRQASDALIKFLNSAPTPFHSVAALKEIFDIKA